MKTAVIYRSFLGATKQYAKWLGEDLGADVFTFRQIADDKLSGYDAVIISSGTYAGWMPLMGFLKKKWDVIKDKKVAVLAVGSVEPEHPGSKIVYEKIPPEIRGKIKYFKVWGKMCDKEKPERGVKKENLAEVEKLFQ